MRSEFHLRYDAQNRIEVARISRPAWFHQATAVAGWSAVWIALWKLAEILAVNYGISAWYPPAAISLFLMIRYGPPAALAVFVASLLAGSAQWQSYPGYNEVLGSLGHTAAYLIAAQIYRRQLHRHRYSIRPRSIAALVCAALCGATLSSILGNLNFYLASYGRYDFDFERLFGWGVGDFFGAISLCPILLFVAPHLRWSRDPFRKAVSTLRTPVIALAIAIALASACAVISGGSGLNFRLLSVVAVGVYSVIVAHVASPRSAVIYLFFISAISAVWLSTDVAATARIEFAFQISTFLVASLAMIYLSIDNVRARVAAMNRRLRIWDLSEQRDALSERISAVEAEFAQLAHEFKTPLGGIIGLLAVTEGGMASGGGRDQIMRHLKHMRGCAWYLNAMVDDAFDVARITRGQFEPVISDFDIMDLLVDLEVVSQSKFGGEVAFPAEGDAQNLKVRSDRNRLLQILINLVVNAVRYSDRRGTVRVACSVAPENVTIFVESAAESVTRAQIDAYIEGGHGVAENSKGLGIGLPLVGKLAAGIGAQLSTAVSGGVVTISVTIARV